MQKELIRENRNIIEMVLDCIRDKEILVDDMVQAMSLLPFF
jgi:hypothetical protein